MRVIYLGSGRFGLDCLKTLAASGHSLSLIVTQPAKPAGRGKKTRPTAVSQWAARNAANTPIIETEDINCTESVRRIKDGKPELMVVIAFGQKLSGELINLPVKGTINVHASLLPKYRGAAPINRAIINGEKKTGISIISLAEKMDAGKIISQLQTVIKTDETAGQLHDRLAKIAVPLLTKTLLQIDSGTAVYTEQSESEVTYAPRLKKSDGYLDFNDTAESIKRRILGCQPWPGAAAVYLSRKTEKRITVTIVKADVVKTSNIQDAAEPGLLDENLNVVCGKDVLKIKQIKPAGGRIMSFSDFVNGRATKQGDLFMKIES